MTPQILGWLIDVALPHLLARRTSLSFPLGYVLEVGALDVNGSPRQLIAPQAVSYIGVDQEAGPGVDHVDDIRRFLYDRPADKWDLIICCETLEHDLYPWDTVHMMRNHLRLGGFLVLTTPTFGFPLHRYPKDYWRFGEDAYREVLLRGMDILDLSHLESEAGPATTIAALACKTSALYGKTLIRP